MIILRYLTREVLQAATAVSVVLVIIIMTGRFVKYLSEAATGKFDSTVLFSIMFYRLPGFLELIIPLGFMVAIIMAYGRLYAEHEMTVLSSCGMSQRRLLTYTFIPGAVIAIIVGMCSLWLTPLGLQKADQIITHQKSRSEIDVVKPGRFQDSRTNAIVTYIEEKDKNKQLKGVFIASTGVAKDKPLTTIKAGSAQRVAHEQYQQNYLQLNDGVRYEGRPGEGNYRITYFEHLGQRLPEQSDADFRSNKIDSQPTLDLLGDANVRRQAALQARFSAPLVIFIITILAVAMSYTTPRRGRYIMLFPAIVIYLVYLVLLNSAREAIEEGSLSVAIGLWPVHLLFLFIACFLFAWRTGAIGRFLRVPKQKRKN